MRDSLEQDLRRLINNPKYSDIEILCQDKKKLHCCRAILAARSEVFDRLLYNGMKESYEKQISFPEISSPGMEIVLEYIYTDLIKEGSLTKDNIVEAFHAADYFQLPDIKDFIVKTAKNILKKYNEGNYSPELLSKMVEIMPFTEDNSLLNLLVEKVSIMQLNTIEFGRLSIEGLQCLLFCTHKEEKSFATSEYEVFRYSAMLVAKQVSNDAYKTLIKRLPTLEQLENLTLVEYKQNEPITHCQKVAIGLEPLFEFIDFRRIKTQILTNIIEPLGIIPNEIISNIFQYHNSNNPILNNTRGTFYIFDKSACGSKLEIKDDGKVVRALSGCYGCQSVGTKMVLENGIFEWKVIIEKASANSWVGVCASENFKYELFAGFQPTGWVLGSSGSCFNNNTSMPSYCFPFGDGTEITVHLDMNERNLSFTVNGTKHPVVPYDLPSKLYPVVSLCYPGRFRIQKIGL